MQADLGQGAGISVSSVSSASLGNGTEKQHQGIDGPCHFSSSLLLAVGWPSCMSSEAQITGKQLLAAMNTLREAQLSKAADYSVESLI